MDKKKPFFFIMVAGGFVGHQDGWIGSFAGFFISGSHHKADYSCVYIYFGTQFEPHNHIFSGTEGVYFYETIFQDEFINITFTFSNLIQ